MYKQDFYWSGNFSQSRWLNVMPEQNGDILPIILPKGKRIKKGQCILGVDTTLNLEFYIDGELARKPIRVGRGSNRFAIGIESKKDTLLTVRAVNIGDNAGNNTDFLMQLFIV